MTITFKLVCYILAAVCFFIGFIKFYLTPVPKPDFLCGGLLFSNPLAVCIRS